MYSLLKGTWALFFGVGMIMLANGLQGSLIGVRASLEGYSALSAGIILTGYYAGFLSCLLYTSDAADEEDKCRSRWSPYH